MRPIRILIAEDSDLFATVLRATLDAEPDMSVVGLAADGEQAVSMCGALAPDLVLMDIQMPRMDGLTATERIMADHPTPILVVTADPHRDGADMSFRALSAGALDLMPKPSTFPWLGTERDNFLRKVRLLAQIPVVRHQRASRRKASLTATPQPREALPPLVGVVGSTGGPRALAKFLGDLPASFPAPIFVVQHIIPGFAGHLARWLDSVSDLTVREARPGQQAEAGNVYIAPDSAHLLIDAALRMRLTAAKPVAGHRPSGDLLLESLARHAARRAIGVVLSGMGSDGASGLAAIYRGGGTTMVQDRASCVVYGMPQSALDLAVVQHVVDLDAMADALIERVDALEGTT